MTTQPGWHPDPAPAQPGQPPRLRWWDGARWTEHTTPVPQQAPPPADDAGRPGPYQGQFGGGPAEPLQQPYDQNPYGQDPDAPTSYGPAYPRQQYPQQAYGQPAYGQPGYGQPYGPGRKMTPDGVPLSGWWWRGLALFIDGLILIAIGVLLAFPFVRELVRDYRAFIDSAQAAADAGRSIDTGQFQRDIQAPVRSFALIQLALSFVYNVGFLMWKQATPGKLVCGLRVRLRDRAGRMPLRTVLMRWVGQYGVGIIGWVPIVGSIASLYTVIDDLWPLWDDKKQALHDKIAKTNVVRVR